VFLDRDGTIIYDKDYLHSPAQVKLYSFACQCINKLHENGFKVIVITNQSGIARKKFSFRDLEEIHKRMNFLLKEGGAKVDGIYFCPHVDEDKCDCRKPKAGMFFKAKKEHNLDLTKSFMVGDSIRDYLAGYAMGGQGILVKTGHGRKQSLDLPKQKVQPLAVCATLKEAVNFIIRISKKSALAELQKNVKKKAMKI
jgi:histidinol-phosphate phosphatase family protein